MFPAASAALGVRIDVVAQPAMNWRLYCASLKLVMSRRSPSWESSFTRTRMPYNPGGLPSAEVTRNNIVAETPTASTPMHVVVPLIWWRLSSEGIVTLLLGPIAPVPAPGPPLASSGRRDGPRVGGASWRICRTRTRGDHECSIDRRRGWL